MAEELDDDGKIRQLAEWSTKYRNGTRSMIESGWNEADLDEAVETAEQELAAEQKAQAKARRMKKEVARF